MTTAYSLTKPHPDHAPTVGRVRLGQSRHGGFGVKFGTLLHCSCGWKPAGRHFAAVGKVSNEPPSKGGRAAALAAYRAHLDDVCVETER